ncbi:MAG TPA: hypothetical protein VNG91_03825, partial [Terriglobia bacterium]|nr:hypothetical protein [Terriglobia bacterium]
LSVIPVRESAVALAFAVVLAFLSVIPAGNLLLPLLLPLFLLFFLSFPQGICCCFYPCLCSCFSFCHSRRESAVAFILAFVLASLSVIPAGNLLLLLSLPLFLLFFLSFPQGICCCRQHPVPSFVLMI